MIKTSVSILALFLVLAVGCQATPTDGGKAGGKAGIEGTVIVGGQPVGDATVTLWKTAGTDAPESLAEVTTDANGGFAIPKVSTKADGDVFYLTTKSGAGDAVALMSVLGTEHPDKVVVNELTTVASAFTSARFIDGTAIRGNALGLRIAAGNAPNLVDPVTGTWGKVLLDPINSTENTTLVRLNTLGALITAFATAADDKWRADFLKAAAATGGTAPKDTLGAMVGIARAPWANPKALYALFDQAYPQPKDGARRSAPFLPYLAYTPPDFAMILKFAGGGIYSAGNVWVANNWNVLDALDNPDPARPTSTKGGGDGIVVIYGVASPVKTPLMGQVQQP